MCATIKENNDNVCRLCLASAKVAQWHRTSHNSPEQCSPNKLIIINGDVTRQSLRLTTNSIDHCFFLSTFCSHCWYCCCTICLNTDGFGITFFFVEQRRKSTKFSSNFPDWILKPTLDKLLRLNSWLTNHCMWYYLIMLHSYSNIFREQYTIWSIHCVECFTSYAMKYSSVLSSQRAVIASFCIVNSQSLANFANVVLRLYFLAC